MSDFPSRPARLYQQVADMLTRAILAGDLGPGDRLPAERELAQRYGVSRPTVREAIIALELAGHVEVRVGSGVYVVDAAQPLAVASEPSAGPFEVLEARCLVEGEAAALAATLITDEELDELDRIIENMVSENRRGVAGELADQRFHLTIARATQNSALVAVVERLWELRNNSPVSVRLLDQVRAKGVRPIIEDHRAIVDALRARRPASARAAMRGHLTRVIDDLLDATEIEEIEAARADVRAKRARFTAGRRLR